MFSKRIIVALLLTLIVALAVSCGRKGEEVIQPADAPAGPLWKPTGNEGNLVGIITFAGVARESRKLDTASDSKCGEVMLDSVIVNDGKLQNVFVYVKSGLPQASFETPTAEVVLDQKGCTFAPRVLGLQTGQILSVLNSDETNHNIHPVPKLNKEWNESQLAGQGPIKRKFVKQEVLIPVKCNQHPWMSAYIGVMGHPFFAVSDSNGSFSIKGLPPGEYEIEAWHEKYGSKTTKVKVDPKSDAKADFMFEASTAYTPGSLKIEPAVVIP